MTVYRVDWSDAQVLAKWFPLTFDCPTASELESLEPGRLVKISDGQERFWVVIDSIQGSSLVGRVDNQLIGGQPYDLNSAVAFELRHIYAIG